LWKGTRFICPFPLRAGHISMGGRFGKYGDAKRKARLRKSRLTPPDLRQRAKQKMLQEVRKRKKRRGDQRAGA